MPDACSVDAQRLFPECSLDGQDRPPDGLLQNGLCDFIPNPACQSFFLFIVLYWHSLHTGRVGAKVFYKTGIEDTSFLFF